MSSWRVVGDSRQEDSAHETRAIDLHIHTEFLNAISTMEYRRHSNEASARAVTRRKPLRLTHHQFEQLRHLFKLDRAAVVLVNLWDILHKQIPVISEDEINVRLNTACMRTRCFRLEFDGAITVKLLVYHSLVCRQRRVADRLSSAHLNDQKPGTDHSVYNDDPGSKGTCHDMLALHVFLPVVKR